MIIILGYGLYLSASIFLVFKVGTKLHRDGAIWLDALFNGQYLAHRINNLLLLGYYLVNGGFAIYALTNWNLKIYPLLEALRKTGAILLILSYLHYQNIITIYFLHNTNFFKKWKV